MPSTTGSIFKFMPWIVVAALVGANAWVLMSPADKFDEDGVWIGKPVPGKPLPLSDQADALFPEAPSQAAGSPAAEHTSEIATPPDENPERDGKSTDKPAASPAPDPDAMALETRFLVQIGSFVLDAGLPDFLERVRSRGLEAHVQSVMETTHLNDVQAGPYTALENAREDEAKLRAAGMDVGLEKTEEGFVIFLSRSPLLGYAIQDLEKVRGLGVKKVRIVKARLKRAVKKVMLGPFATKHEAKMASAKVAKWGLGTPKIKKAGDSGYVPSTQSRVE